ncbi:hypothetical protein N473_05575 [Pseudoalteromonas luteoviolacea CPMOR-1]|uniref:Undecaprenyl-phosphate alpha-N-acetylglucosaminyl 1-phosphate transferase n=1 Tax=Pseudoalteromonas luteoviolacea CPMOR-1 TaxID=1365248 RepID=A0A167HJT7_9GAMM|nr:UDP-N-acetylglucosamine--undecaprenyl-phosphate N-acetylglucosaminephosphotransferase [Pseudoalteromonas luteoviolacea]KZN58212.1 hypothetical protein N473_05575 [Pseudoalteromonas luteoviolacea CPMOR-1]
MYYVLPLITAFVCCFLAIRLVQPVAVKAGLVDVPNSRKHHSGSIPLIGGVAIYIGVIMSSLFFFSDTEMFHVYVLSASVILFLGVLDDKFDLSVRVRVIVQMSVASLMIFGAGIYIDSFGYILGFFELKLGVFGVVVTIFAVIGAINAFNMVDGIDGLAGALSAISFAVLAFMLARTGSSWYLLPALFVAAICAFLMFNLRWPNKGLNKVFMGDAGSMFIGLTIIWLLVIGTQPESEAFRPVAALYIIAVPLMDMAAIMYRRIRKGTSPFKPDRDHLHHIFERAGYNRKQALAYISCISIAIALLGCLMEVYLVNEAVMFFTFIFMFVIYNFILSRIWRIISKIRMWKNKRTNKA